MPGTLTLADGACKDVSVSEHRVEHDSHGEVLVPSHAHWGAHTQRAAQHFQISGERARRPCHGVIAFQQAQALAPAEGPRQPSRTHQGGRMVRRDRVEVPFGGRPRRTPPFLEEFVAMPMSMACP